MAPPNQPPPLVDYDLFGADIALRDALARHGAGWAADEAGRLGRALASAETIALGEAANRHAPQLLAFDRFGDRLDEVEYHPAYHAHDERSASAPASTPCPGSGEATAAMSRMRHWNTC